MNEPIFFKPHALTRKLQPNAAPIVFEGRITDDLSMPEQDWSRYDEPTHNRRTSKVIRSERRQAAC